MHRFLWNKCEELNLVPIMINGMQDHVHLLIKIPSTITIAEIAKNLKAPSSRYLNELTKSDYFEWSRGYGAFTVSNKEADIIAQYIKNQKIHHSKGTVIEEFEH